MATNFSSKVGSWETDIFTPTTEYPNPPIRLGEIVDGPWGQTFMFCQASGAITAGDCVNITGAGVASAMTKTLADAALGRVGFAQVAVPSGSFFWAAIRGQNINCRVLTGSTTVGTGIMYTTATAGVLSNTSTSQTAIFGVSLQVANSSGSTAAREIFAPAPRYLS